MYMYIYIYNKLRRSRVILAAAWLYMRTNLCGLPMQCKCQYDGIVSVLLFHAIGNQHICRTNLVTLSSSLGQFMPGSQMLYRNTASEL